MWNEWLGHIDGPDRVIGIQLTRFVMQFDDILTRCAPRFAQIVCVPAIWWRLKLTLDEWSMVAHVQGRLHQKWEVK